MALKPVMENPSEQSQDAPAAGAPQGGGKFEQMLTSVSSNLVQIQKLFAQEGVPDELTSKLSDLNDQYQSILQEITKSLGGEGSQGPVKPGSPGSGMVDAQGGIEGVPV